MLQTLDEIKKAEMSDPVVINGVDNPNLLSVDSTTPIQTGADEVKPEDNEKGGEVKKEDAVVGKSAGSEEETDKKVGGSAKKLGEEKPTADGKDPDKGKGAEKRIGELTKKWRAAERERDFEKNKRLEAEKALKEVKSKIVVGEKPKREAFDSDEEFVEALTDWKIDSKLKASQEEVTKTVSDREEKDAITEVYNNLDAMVESGKEKYEDFAEKVFDKALSISPDMTEIILDSDTEVSVEIMYYLASNPDESAEIAKMSKEKAARMIGKIEAKLAAKSAAEEENVEKKGEEDLEKVPPKKKLTNAPEPIKPVRTTGVVDKDPSQMSAKEYRQWRERDKR